MTKTPPKSPYRGRFKTPVRFEAERANALSALDEFSPEVHERVAVSVAPPSPGVRLMPLQPPPARQPMRIALRIPSTMSPVMWLGLVVIVSASVMWMAARIVTSSAAQTVLLPSTRVAMSPLESQAARIVARPPIVRRGSVRSAAVAAAAARTAALPKTIASVATPKPVAATPKPVAASPKPVAAGAKPQAAPATPAGFFGALAIDATPAGARVFINGRLAGTAPIEVRDLSAGSRVVRIEADGYQPWSAAVRIVADQQARISVALHPAR
jgi:hypothetical protein